MPYSLYVLLRARVIIDVSAQQTKRVRWDLNPRPTAISRGMVGGCRAIHISPPSTVLDEVCATDP